MSGLGHTYRSIECTAYTYLDKSYPAPKAPFGDYDGSCSNVEVAVSDGYDRVLYSLSITKAKKFAEILQKEITKAEKFKKEKLDTRVIKKKKKK